MSQISTRIASTPGRRSGSAPWLIRGAEQRDIVGIVAAVGELLGELGAAPPPPQAMLEAAWSLLEDGQAGELLVAEAEGALVGILTASWQTAIHIPGRYGLIQDLWVDPAWRSQAIGAALLEALCERARDRGIARIEVGLPKESFPGLAATASFYRANGFQALGPRMRRLSS